jgi:alkylated DNA repair dioxygenase AlkB
MARNTTSTTCGCTRASRCRRRCTPCAAKWPPGSDFDVVVGVSLGGEARMRLRPYPPVAPKKTDVLSLALAPRSAYVLRGDARWRWQHSIAPTTTLRWSITFRTPRRLQR